MSFAISHFHLPCNFKNLSDIVLNKSSLGQLEPSYRAAILMSRIPRTGSRLLEEYCKLGAKAPGRGACAHLPMLRLPPPILRLACKVLCLRICCAPPLACRRLINDTQRTNLEIQNVLYFKMRNPVGLKRCKTSSYWRILHLMKLKLQKD